MAHAGGRPTKYTPELLEKARKYVDGDWRLEGDMVPMLCGMAEYCGIHEHTISGWQKDDDKPEFLALCARVMQMQKRGLINGGLSESMNQGTVKLMLNRHGISDKQELDHTSSDGTMTPKNPVLSLQDLYSGIVEPQDEVDESDDE